MSRRRGTFDSLVNADSEAEAIEVAAEAVPRGASVVESSAEDVSAEHGTGTWLVKIRFQRIEPEGEI
jgi:hypothetical protein